MNNNGLTSAAVILSSFVGCGACTSVLGKLEESSYKGRYSEQKQSKNCCECGKRPLLSFMEVIHCNVVFFVFTVLLTLMERFFLFPGGGGPTRAPLWMSSFSAIS